MGEKTLFWGNKSFTFKPPPRLPRCEFLPPEDVNFLKSPSRTAADTSPEKWWWVVSVYQTKLKWDWSSYLDGEHYIYNIIHQKLNMIIDNHWYTHWNAYWPFHFGIPIKRFKHSIKNYWSKMVSTLMITVWNHLTWLLGEPMNGYIELKTKSPLILKVSKPTKSATNTRKSSPVGSLVGGSVINPSNWEHFPQVSGDTPWKFNIAPEKWWLEDYFPIGKVTFQGLC